MPLYSGPKDRAYFRHINRELLRKIIAQEVVYYKISLPETQENVFGESKDKMYNQPILINCSIIPEDQTNVETEIGPDRNQTIRFNFLRDDLIEVELEPFIGDIVMWEEGYYEVHNVVDNQRVMGKDWQYSLENDNENHGELWTISCDCHLTKVNKLNIIQSR